MSNSRHHAAKLKTLSNGRYRIKKRLGVGGMASVFLAYDNHLETDVAIKIPHRHLIADERFHGRFLRETKSLVSLRHPGIVRIIDSGHEQQCPYSVMDYLPGGNLNDRRFRGKDGKLIPVLPAFFKQWLTQVADALDFMHRKGFVHRDIKPDNILFDVDGNAFLSDFGIAKAYSELQDSNRGLTQTGTIIGTAEYIAPEISLGQPYDGSSDQFSLAVSVYELLVAQRPFAGTTPQAIIIEQTKPSFCEIDHLVALTGDEVKEILVRALSVDPELRFGSCSEFAEVLSAAFGRLPKRLPRETVSSACPMCQTPIAVQPEWVGQIAKCNHCSERLQIQLTGTVTPAGTPLEPLDEDEAALLEIHCPNCLHILGEADRRRDTEVTCSGCQETITIRRDGTTVVAGEEMPHDPRRRNVFANRGLVVAAAAVTLIVAVGAAAFYMLRSRHQPVPAGIDPSPHVDTPLDSTGPSRPAVPSFDPISDQSVDERAEFRLLLPMSRPPAGGMKFRFGARRPAAMTLDPKTGEIEWQTEETDGGKEYVVDVQLRDSDSSILASTSFSVSVVEINHPPVIAPTLEPTQVVAGETRSQAGWVVSSMKVIEGFSLRGKDAREKRRNVVPPQEGAAYRWECAVAEGSVLRFD